MRKIENKIRDSLRNSNDDKISYPWEYEFPSNSTISMLDVNKDLDTLKAELTMMINGQINIVEDKNVKNWSFVIKKLINEKIKSIQNNLEQKILKRIETLSNQYDKKLSVIIEDKLNYLMYQTKPHESKLLFNQSFRN